VAGGRGYIGGFEQIVLLAVARLGQQAYGMRVRQEIEKTTDRRVAIGAVYATLDRMEQKGLVKSRDVAGGPERGGRARRYFTVTALGADALNESRTTLARLWSGLPAGVVA
jgi:PadR family transcriptional regulator PadR